MPGIELVCKKIFTGSQCLNRFLIGGLLCFIPVVNFFALGYLYRYAQEVRNNGEFELPAWSDWPGLFVDGLRLLVIIALFFGLPVLLGCGLSCLLCVLFTKLGLAIFAYLPLGLALFVSPALTVAALYRFQAENQYRDLAGLDQMIAMLAASWRNWALPGLAFTGLMVVGIPLFGFAFFLGFVVIIAYYTLVFVVLEKQGKAGLA